MIYLNTAASAFPRRQVALDAAMTSLGQPPGDNRNNSMGRAIEAHRQVVANRFGVETGQISFFSDATLALNVLAMAWANSPERVIAYDNRSHNAVTRAVDERMAKKAIVAGLWDRTTDVLCHAAVSDLCALRPDVVFLTATSNVTGTHYPVSEVITELRRHCPACIVVVDAAQRLGSGDASECLSADAVVFAGHKHLGAVPGCAIVVSSVEVPQVLFGGTGINSANARTQLEGRTITEVGTPNDPAVAAIAATIEEVGVSNPIDVDSLNALASDLIAELEGRRLGRVISPKRSERAPIVSIIPRTGDPEAVWTPLLSRYDIVVRGGLHCSPVTYSSIAEPDGALRVSLGFSNTAGDLTQLIDACVEIDRTLS